MTHMTTSTPAWIALLLLSHCLSGSRAAAAENIPADRLSRTNLLLYHKDDGNVAPVRTIADWHRRRAEILDGMQRVMGPVPGPEKRCPLDARVIEEVDCGDYLRRLISYSA